VVPAVFVLNLQQTLIMAAGLMVGKQKQRHGYWSRVAPAKLLLVRSFVLGAVNNMLSLFYFGASFDLHGVNTLAKPNDLF
ncbi:ABC transporter permease, partial [Vibrio cholerae]